MVRPMTKISPISRIAAPTAWRTNGSPARERRRLRALACSLSLTRARPITSPQVALLTRVECDLPLCERQSALPSLSAISWSAVSGSGTRRNASASESRAMPFRRVQPIFLEELVDPARRLGGAELAEHGQRPLLDPPARIGIERGVAQKRLQHLRLRRAVQLPQFGTRGCRSVRHVSSSRGLSFVSARL